jgi:serine phosphatase RsbU (regulator of sigma subunit)
MDFNRQSPVDAPTVVVTTTRPTATAVSRDDWVHYLVVLEGAEQGRRIALGKDPIRLGRREPCELVLADSEVSGLHCQVHIEAGTEAMKVMDLGSTNGTFVDGLRVPGTASGSPGALLQLGRQVLRHEFRPPREAERSDELDRDLETASRYIRSLLPAPIQRGPVRAEWVFQPSAKLGGDALGYFQIDAHRFAGYLIDVSGHGIGAAVHTVSVLNVMRQRALPGVDLSDPAQVLTRLNAMFPMDEHGGLFFTMWYGVYDAPSRTLWFASAGQHPAYLVAADRSSMQPLHTRNPMIGALPDHRFVSAAVDVYPGSLLHVFSDGLFEIDAIDGKPGRLADFAPQLLKPPEPGMTEPERLQAAARGLSRPGPPEDDVSVLTVTFLS